MDSHTLVANIGGYIGLCLGYNLLQVPALITTVFKKLKVYFKSEKLIKTSNNISNSFDAKDNKENGHDEKQKKLNNDDCMFNAKTINNIYLLYRICTKNSFLWIL